MIWYLLYPFRGTTEAPVLPDSHPFRGAFARYGRYASSHVVTTLLVSVAVAAILIYPFPFLYTTDVTNGASILPEHAWTDTLLLSDKNRVEPDVIMRSIWVHGNYFEALNRNVLLNALELQDELLGPTVNFNPRRPIVDNADVTNITATDLTPTQRDAYHVVNGLTNESWFFQSPLQYWSCSAENIEQDDDIIITANERKSQPTSVNVTLRHSIVFSGKRFQDRQLVAADALVITLVHYRDSPVGLMWQERAEALREKMTGTWDIFEYSDLNGKTSELYEFQFRPMSSQDMILLGLAYSLVLIYFLISLSKLRAVKSKVGLMVTVIAQILLAILSSFTICAILKIDLSRIPRLGYPVVIFSMSLENIFRLINAVILTPSEDNTSSRIGQAFGETGHVALTSVAQNLLILFGLSKIVSPGVSAFCTFAAIALIFDFFYLSTFFLSVLSVDVRRTELSDALAKASIRAHRSASETQLRQTWIDAMLQGKIAMSTRIAGTIVMVGFVLIAQWHFFENENVAKAISRAVHISPKYKDPSLSSALIEVHQGRSPASWLGLQDHETAREFIQVVKPDAHSYIAKVFHPMVFVLKGSDRNLSTNEPWFPPAVYDFVRHQSASFMVTILVIAAAVCLLMNYLLWDELADSTGSGSPDGGDPLLSVKTLSRGHALDVAVLSACSDGHLVSVGLDRVVRVWDVKAGGKSYVLDENEDSSIIPFPIFAMCIDEESHWLALLTFDKVLLWHLAEHRWGPVIRAEPDRHKPEAFFFVADDTACIPALVLIRRDGIITELRTDQAKPTNHMISKESPIVSVDFLSEKGFPAQVMASTRDGHVRIATQEGAGWTSDLVNVGSPEERGLISIQALPELGFFLIIRSKTVDLVDSQTLRAIYTFKVDPIQPKSLKCFHSRPRRMRCGSVALWSFTLAYLNAYNHDLVVQTYSPQHEGESLCFCDPASPTRKTCCPWQRAKESRRVIKNPGLWDALPSGIMVGIRRKTNEKSRADGHHNHQPLQQLSGLRRRHQSTQPTNGHVPQDNWEVWMFSHFGKQETWETLPLSSKIEDDGHLFVTNLGPMVRVGRASLAVGLSNVIKVIMVGNERFETGDDSQPGDGMPALGSRRRKGPSTLRGKSALHCPHC